MCIPNFMPLYVVGLRLPPDFTDCRISIVALLDFGFTGSIWVLLSKKLSLILFTSEDPPIQEVRRWGDVFLVSTLLADFPENILVLQTKGDNAFFENLTTSYCESTKYSSYRMDVINGKFSDTLTLSQSGGADYNQPPVQQMSLPHLIFLVITPLKWVFVDYCWQYTK